MKLTSLDELLQYKNQQVVHYFCHHYPTFSEQQAHQLFRDLLAWMWLTLQRKSDNRHTFLFGPLLPLDTLWHAFILHTRDYQAFCQLYFGQFFHHDVEPIGQAHEVSPDELADFLEDCFTYLGEDWVERYFSEAFA
ncbi:Uncharacterized conserved protein [Legionella beliardensis]|uniref:Uncharacterized conserved protein n=1 Tax=Legionella beliardensis TaxID=91822 RepID=A0A378HZJ4_9GAMM|nr:hypothetical protein [Legionella beliardensis]STX28172.1 Uncharacterized conserved protein [Legionella beliardensis]